MDPRSVHKIMPASNVTGMPRKHMPGDSLLPSASHLGFGQSPLVPTGRADQTCPSGCLVQFEWIVTKSLLALGLSADLAITNHIRNTLTILSYL